MKQQTATFSADWLALREPADHAAIDGRLRARFCERFAAAPEAMIVDLGSGSGSCLRALAPHLPERQRWRLVDHDAALLDHARRALAHWADSAAQAGANLVLQKDGRRIEVETFEADLAVGGGADVFDRAFAGSGAVTACAFFDLVSPAFMARLAEALAARKLPLYALLTYDGDERWAPPHRADGAMLRAFHADQRRDKGFGPAAGPDAPQALRQAFEQRGCNVLDGASPWRLGAEHRALIAALAEGSAKAVTPAMDLSAAEIASWRDARRIASACRIGHVDLLAEPPV